jgi:transposase
MFSYFRVKEVKLLTEKISLNFVYLSPYRQNIKPIKRLWKLFKKKNFTINTIKIKMIL